MVGGQLAGCGCGIWRCCCRSLTSERRTRINTAVTDRVLLRGGRCVPESTARMCCIHVNLHADQGDVSGPQQPVCGQQNWDPKHQLVTARLRHARQCPTHHCHRQLSGALTLLRMRLQNLYLVIMCPGAVQVRVHAPPLDCCLQWSPVLELTQQLKLALQAEGWQVQRYLHH